MESILDDEKNYDTVILAGHSLGSAIAYDTMNRVHKKPEWNADFEGRIKGLITFGSPLDKIAFFFREQTLDKACIRRQILDHIHSFKRKELCFQENSIEVKDETRHNVEDVRWINFYDSNDPVSGHLDFYEVDENVRLKMGKKWGTRSHEAYWGYPEMYEKIRDTFLKPAGNQ